MLCLCIVISLVDPEKGSLYRENHFHVRACVKPNKQRQQRRHHNGWSMKLETWITINVVHFPKNIQSNFLRWLVNSPLSLWPVLEVFENFAKHVTNGIWINWTSFWGGMSSMYDDAMDISAVGASVSQQDMFRNPFWINKTRRNATDTHICVSFFFV